MDSESGAAKPGAMGMATGRSGARRRRIWDVCDVEGQIKAWRVEAGLRPFQILPGAWMAESPARLVVREARISACTLEFAADLRYARDRPSGRSRLATGERHKGHNGGKNLHGGWQRGRH